MNVMPWKSKVEVEAKVDTFEVLDIIILAKRLLEKETRKKYKDFYKLVIKDMEEELKL
jgi:hypothetical protein